MFATNDHEWLSARTLLTRLGGCCRRLGLDIDSVFIDLRISSGLKFRSDGCGFGRSRSGEDGVQFSDFASFEPC